MEIILNWIGLGLITLLLAIALAVFTAYPTMLLWNVVIPGIFGLPTIDFLQALALSLLCSILFKSSDSSSSK